MDTLIEHITWLAIVALSGFLAIAFGILWLLMEVKFLGTELTRTREQLVRRQELSDDDSRRRDERLHQRLDRRS